MKKRKLLLLAGSGEARILAGRLDQDGSFDLVTSLAGATRKPASLAGSIRIGGFGAMAGFQAYLKQENIGIVVDATHPFAARMSTTAIKACAAMNIPFVQLSRPEWHPEPDDNWISVKNPEQAARHIPKGATVFLATGRQTLMAFGAAPQARLLCRVIDKPVGPFPFDDGRFIVGRPPFSVQEETDLFQAQAVDILVAKNSGGEPSKTKLIAARNLGLPVIMVERPEQPDCARVATIDAVLDWLAGLPEPTEETA